MNGPTSLEDLAWDMVKEKHGICHKSQIIHKNKPINKKNPLYLLEGRKRKRNDRYIPNDILNTIGVFTSPENAQNWIKTEGVTFYPPHFKRYKDYFYAVVEINNLNTCDGFLENFYDKHGNKINKNI